MISIVVGGQMDKQLIATQVEKLGQGIGGCKYIQQQYSCPVFAPGIEKTFTQYPVLEPSFLYGGYPCADLRHKFLLAQPSDAVDLADPRFPMEVEPLPLPGHFFDMQKRSHGPVRALAVGRGNQSSEKSTNSQWAATPAQRPPMVWLMMALLMSSVQSRLFIIETWVLRYPLQHMHMAVKTAISRASTY